MLQQAEAENGGFVQPGKGKGSEGGSHHCRQLCIWRETGAELSWEVPRGRVRVNSTQGRFQLDIRKNISPQGQLDSGAGPREGRQSLHLETFSPQQGQ